MPGLYQSLVDGTFDMQNKRDLSTDFARELLNYRDEIVDKYLKHGISLNKSISDLAKSKHLTDDQIKRIVEECNNQIYLIKYSKLKSEPERNVNFEIASFKKIKGDENKDSNNSDKEEKSAFSLSESLEKTASLQYKEPGDYYCDLSMPSPTLKAEKETGLNEIILNKMASDISEQNEYLNKISNELDNGLGKISNAIINLDKLGTDVSDLFYKMVSENSIFTDNQDIIKTAIEKTVDSYKENNMYPISKNIELKVVDFVPNEFGLGEYSLCKEAMEDISIPAIAVEGEVIDSASQLSKLFSKVNGNIEEFRKISSELKEKESLLKEALPKFDYEALEKIAGNNNFFNALLGVTKKKTSQNLSNAKKELEALRSVTKGLDKATQKVNRAQNRVNNIDNHFIFKGHKEKLTSLGAKKDYIAQSNKRILEKGKGRDFRDINKQIKNVSKKENEVKNNMNSLKSNMNNLFEDKLNEAKANVNKIKNTSGIASAEQNLKKQQEAYKKAVRQTRGSRFLVGGGVALAGSQILKKNKENNQQSGNLNTNNYYSRVL